MYLEHYFFLYVGGMLLLAGGYVFYKKKKKLAYIDDYTYHKGLLVKFKKVRPELNDMQIRSVSLGLKDYFKICQMAKDDFVSMPSQVVDDLWHEFILFTKEYQGFCQRAFGKYLHHTPSEALINKKHASKGLKRAWKLACSLENIDPKNPARLPRLFALDGLYNIENGFYYEKDCRNSNGTGYCASHIGCSNATGCSGGSSCGGSSCGSSCGGGCGGS